MKYKPTVDEQIIKGIVFVLVVVFIVLVIVCITAFVNDLSRGVNPWGYGRPKATRPVWVDSSYD